MVTNTQKTWRYLDSHMVLPQLDFLEEQKLVSGAEILKARTKAVESTGMVDYLVELLQEAKSEIPHDLESKKAVLMADFEAKQASLKPLLEVVEKSGAEGLKLMSLADLCLKYNLSSDVLDVMFDYARLSYNIGDYKTCAELLKIYRILTSSTETQTAPTDKQMRAMWGSIASYIALGDYAPAAELVVKLIEFFESSTLPKDKFSYGASGLWLIHWAVLIALKSRNVDLLTPLLKEKYLNVISVSAGYLWRYMSSLIVLSPISKIDSFPMSEVALLISKDAEACKDPINVIIVDTFMRFSFDDKSSLDLIEESVKSDYYLHDLAKDLVSKSAELRSHMKTKLYE